jgi:hypothetical protein
VSASWRRVTGRSVLSVVGIRLLWVILPVCTLGSRQGGRKWFCSLPGGGIMVPWTSSWSRPFVRVGWNGGVSVCEAPDKLIPVLFVGCSLNPTFERAECVNCDLPGIRNQLRNLLTRVTMLHRSGRWPNQHLHLSRIKLCIGDELRSKYSNSKWSLV